VDEACERIRASGYPRADEYATEVAIEDPDRPERLSRLIEGV
jgi:hypothetical protein